MHKAARGVKPVTSNMEQKIVNQSTVYSFVKYL